MNTFVFIFIPTETTPKNFREHLRDCIASLPDVPLPEAEKTDARPKAAPPPFWTMFLPNPLPTPKN
ncbi:MAG: hypothetical protein NTV08_14205 [Verrucomicrobia bacterium]|nr:hypothetical protein [Verrucomicrobiota bacterium]